jgi:hypothetical protein
MNKLASDGKQGQGTGKTVMVRKKYVLLSGHHCLVVLEQAWVGRGGQGHNGKRSLP